MQWRGRSAAPERRALDAPACDGKRVGYACSHARPAAAQARPLEPRAAAIAAAADALGRSRRPLVSAGAGAHPAGARDALVHLADRIGAALATTLKAKDLFRGHPFDCGVLGSFSQSAGRRVFPQVDAVLAVGAGLNLRTTARGDALTGGATIVHVDHDRTRLGRWHSADDCVAGDARLVVDRLLEALSERAEHEQPLRCAELRQALAEHEPSRDFVAADTDRTIDPRRVAVELDCMLPRDRQVVFDAGNFLVATPYLSMAHPGRLKQASDFSSIGLGLGVAIGFTRAAPERVTLLMAGNGGLLMTPGELETVAREGLPIVLVVMNDCVYGAELHYLRLRGASVATARFADVEYAPVARAFGWRTETVRCAEDLRALAPLLAAPDGPLLLDCKINGQVAAPCLTDGWAPERNRSGGDAA